MTTRDLLARRVASIAVVTGALLALQASPLATPTFLVLQATPLATSGETVWRGEGTMHFRASAQLDPSQMGEARG